LVCAQHHSRQQHARSLTARGAGLRACSSQRAPATCPLQHAQRDPRTGGPGHGPPPPPGGRPPPPPPPPPAAPLA
jgi:hypothetical protein